MNKFDKAYARIINESLQGSAAKAASRKNHRKIVTEEEDTEQVYVPYQEQVDWLEKNGFKKQLDETEYGYDWVKDFGAFRIAVNLFGKNNKAEVKAKIYYIGGDGAPGRLIQIGGYNDRTQQWEPSLSAEETVKNCFAFLKNTLASEIEELPSF